jgi:hypothetical protein
MDSRREEATRLLYEFPVSEKKEERSCSLKSRKLRNIAAWAMFLILAFSVYGVLNFFSFNRTKINMIKTGQRGGLSLSYEDYRVPTEEMIREDFEKWSRERLRSSEERLQNLQMKVEMVQGPLRAKAQQSIQPLKIMLDSAQARLSKLQNCDGALWNGAQRDMIVTLRDLKKAQYRAEKKLTGFKF